MTMLMCRFLLGSSAGIQGLEQEQKSTKGMEVDGPGEGAGAVLLVGCRPEQMPRAGCAGLLASCGSAGKAPQLLARAPH